MVCYNFSIMKIQIINAKVVLPSDVLDGATVVFENGKIVFIGKGGVDDAITVDGNGGYLFAGFIDVHCHGGNGYDFMDAEPSAVEKISQFHLSHGTTTLVPTTMTDDWASIENALDVLRDIYNKGKGKTLYGVHLEGPWLSPEQCGAQSVSKMDVPSVEKLNALLKKYPFIKRISLAPELQNGIEVGRACKESGLVTSIAHTSADFDTVIKAIDNGYSVVTHLYSGMTGVTRKNAYRIAGAVEGALYDDRVFVEVIADGKHLPYGLLKLIYKCKGADKVCLITDSMRASGLPDGERSVLGRKSDGLPVIVEDGVAKTLDRQSFAGSVATTDRLLKTVISAGISVVDASKSLSGVPAKIMGLNDRGVIQVGKRADLVLTDENFNILKVFYNGEIVKE